jgi:diguanylate cyclase (GGDEF)-like protein/PAS domain S-box-containing protein
MSDPDGRHSRRRFASALALLTMLGVLATGGYCVYAWFTAKADQLAQLDKLAHFAARSSNFFFDQFGVGLRTLGQNMLARGGLTNLAEAHAMVDRYRREAASGSRVNIFGLDGEWLLSSARPPGAPLPSAKSLPHWEEDMQTALGMLGLSIGRPVPAILGKGRIIPLRQTVRDSAGRNQFILSAVIPLENQQAIWNNLELPPDGVIGLVRSDNYLQSVYPTLDTEARTYEQSLPGEMFHAAIDRAAPLRGHMEGPDLLDARYRLYSYRRLDSYPITAFVGVPRTAVWAAWIERVQVPLALLSLLVLSSVWIYRNLSSQYASWERAVYARQRRLELLNEISAGITAGIPFESLLDSVLDRLASRFPDTRACFAALTGEMQVTLVRVHCLPGEASMRGRQADLESTPPLVTELRGGTTVRIADVMEGNEQAPLPGVFGALSIRAGLFGPLASPSALLGVLVVGSASPRPWSDDDAAMVAEVAGYLSLAMTETRAATERERALSDLAESRERFRSLAELSSDWFWEQDESLRFTYISGGANQRLFDDAKEAIGKRRWELRYIEGLSAEQWQEHRRILEAHEPFTDFVYRVRHNDQLRWVSISGRPVFRADRSFAGYRGAGRDITIQREAEERIRYLAHNDELTGLMNRSSFQEHIAHTVRQAQRHGRRLAVLFIDLDRFKNINDTLGHDAGDRLLVEVARRLFRCVRESDVVSRWGGDEFVALLEEFGSPNDVVTVARRILDSLARPLLIGSQELVVTASVGISTFPDDGQDAAALLKAADIAMYRAKENGKNNFQYYSPQMNVHTFERLTLESNLRRALERGEFLLHFQPKVGARGQGIVGAEALIRWQHPEMGLVSPMQFIPLAEETGLIVPIGSWVLRTACAQGRAWHTSGLPKVRVAVNISSRQFRNETLVAEVQEVLERTRLEPDLLELEITESMLMHDPEQTVRMLNELTALGIHLAIDDFGTGYSSLAYLKRFPVETLKIDRSFIQDVPDDADDVAITLAILAMARNLRIKVTAEGVETKEQLAFLQEHGCDEIQGYLSGRPLPAEEFSRLVRSQLPLRTAVAG